ncbi:MAG: ABC transporter substrate-binding protein [Bacillota bacterium]|nr:ABC transporter substrate-binding protein [Bacillota bacterium]
MKLSKNFGRSLALLLSAACICAFSACGKKEGGVIKFASVAPMTGGSAASGRQQKLGIEIAMDEINKSGGINGNTFAFDVYDDKGLKSQALTAAQGIASDKNIRFVIGHIDSGCSLAALPIYSGVNLPIISGSNTYPAMTDKNYKNYFRTCMDDEQIISQETNFAVKELGFKKIALMSDDTEYGKGGRDVALKELHKLGLTPAADLSFSGKGGDFSGQIKAVKNAGADCVLFIGGYAAASGFLRQRAGTGLLSAAVLSSSSCMNTELLKEAGKAAEGMFTVSPFDPSSPDYMTSSFVAKYRGKSGGETPGELAANSYDAFMAYAHALETIRSEFSQQQLIEALHKMDVFEGASGNIKFDEKGDVQDRTLSYFVVKDGKFAKYTPTKLG